MPTPYLKKVAAEKNLSLKTVESDWDKAKAIVSKFLRKSSPFFWGLVVKIFKAKIEKRTKPEE